MNEMMPSPQNNSVEILPEIRRVRIDRLVIYDVSEAELDTLQRGSPESLYLNFAIFLLSAAITFSVALATTTISSNRTFDVFIILTTIGYIGGTLLAILWGRNRQSLSQVIKRIRNRQPPEGVALTPAQESTVVEKRAHERDRPSPTSAHPSHSPPRRRRRIDTCPSMAAAGTVVLRLQGPHDQGIGRAFGRERKDGQTRHCLLKHVGFDVAETVEDYGRKLFRIRHPSESVERVDARQGQYRSICDTLEQLHDQATALGDVLLAADLEGVQLRVRQRCRQPKPR